MGTSCEGVILACAGELLGVELQSIGSLNTLLSDISEFITTWTLLLGCSKLSLLTYGTVQHRSSTLEKEPAVRSTSSLPLKVTAGTTTSTHVGTDFRQGLQMIVLLSGGGRGVGRGRHAHAGVHRRDDNRQR